MHASSRDAAPARPITPPRLAETTYTRFAGPEHTTVTPFGRLARDPRCPTEWCFFDAHCAADQVDELLQDAAQAWINDPPVRSLVGHDPATRAYLQQRLEPLGWQCFDSTLMVYERPPELAVNPAVGITAVEPATDPLYYEVSGRWATPAVHEHRRVQDVRLGGEGLIAWIGDEPVGYGGWYLCDGLVRFRRLGTMAHARKRHICTTLVRHVQNHPIVASHEALIISGGGPTTAIYGRCGFVERGMVWHFIKIRDNPPPPTAP